MYEITPAIMKRLRAKPGKKISLARAYSTSYDAGLSHDDAETALRESVARLTELQDKLYAQDLYSVLIIFQALDAAGKDGTIKHVMSGLNPQGCEVHSFKAPSDEELEHHFLWRPGRALPQRGRIGVFNRSYYEEVLVVRVHPEFLDRQRLPPKMKTDKIWKNRFKQINTFEKTLTENGTLILKFFLNVSKDEQKKRFLARLTEPDKNWKFSAQDLAERAHWDEYIDYYQECFRETSTDWAPWHIIPADDKAFMRVAVAGIICKALEKLKPSYPEVAPEKRQALMDLKAKLEAER